MRDNELVFHDPDMGAIEVLPRKNPIKKDEMDKIFDRFLDEEKALLYLVLVGEAKKGKETFTAKSVIRLTDIKADFSRKTFQKKVNTGDSEEVMRFKIVKRNLAIPRITTQDIALALKMSPFYDRLYYNTSLEYTVYFAPELELDPNDWRSYTKENQYIADAKNAGRKSSTGKTQGNFYEHFSAWLSANFSFTKKFRPDEISSSVARVMRSSNSIQPVIKAVENADKDPEFTDEYVEGIHDEFLKKFGNVQDPYFEDVMNHVLKAIIMRNKAQDPRSNKFDEVVIFYSTQGLKKSTFTERLSLGYFSDNIKLAEDTDSYRLRAQSVICEMPELAALRKQDTETAKAVTTKTSVRARLPYDKEMTELLLRAVLIGTTNSTEILSDATGNRRWWPVSIESLPALTDDITIALYVWAYRDLKKNKTYWFEANESAKYDAWKQENYGQTSDVDIAIKDFISLLNAKKFPLKAFDFSSGSPSEKTIDCRLTIKEKMKVKELPDKEYYCYFGTKEDYVMAFRDAQQNGAIKTPESLKVHPSGIIDLLKPYLKYMTYRENRSSNPKKGFRFIASGFSGHDNMQLLADNAGDTENKDLPF